MQLAPLEVSHVIQMHTAVRAALPLAAGRRSRTAGAGRGPAESPPAKAQPTKQAGPPRNHPSSCSTSPAACSKRRREGGDEPLTPSKRSAQGAVPRAPPRAAQMAAQGGKPGLTPGRRQAEPKAQQAAPHCLSEQHQQRQCKGTASRPRADQDSPRPRAQGNKSSPCGAESTLSARASRDTRLKGSHKHASVCLAPVVWQLLPRGAQHRLLAQQAAPSCVVEQTEQTRASPSTGMLISVPGACIQRVSGCGNGPAQSRRLPADSWRISEPRVQL